MSALVSYTRDVGNFGCYRCATRYHHAPVTWKYYVHEQRAGRLSYCERCLPWSIGLPPRGYVLVNY